MKKVLIFLGICILIGIGIGVYQWNKPARNVADMKGIKITSVALCNAYSQDEKAADSLYLNKPIAVTGIIQHITKNQDGGTVLILKSDDPILAVQCTMRKKTNITAAEGSSVTVKGFCSGSDIASVLLTDCIME